jgi:hypothetical protein
MRGGRLFFRAGSRIDMGGYWGTVGHHFFFFSPYCLGISGMKGNEGHWGGGISIISQNFPKSPSILFHPLESSISQTSPKTSIRGGISSLFWSCSKNNMIFSDIFKEKMDVGVLTAILNSDSKN